ncbi:uncharacterized protein LOC130933752 [Arachis stenosperma]|uniref:uncharacterized protein LOC130933752 n=1 Tax=Arachis stenosperma TaxID=217475 RepID=UPI0025AD3B8C|nr:uncharacterized protein LOC130933752 [Arachis stenosperma]
MPPPAARRFFFFFLPLPHRRPFILLLLLLPAAAPTAARHFFFFFFFPPPVSSRHRTHRRPPLLLLLLLTADPTAASSFSVNSFCLIIDEVRDESKREQMALIVRFVDKHGFVKERLINIVHVKDTTSATLKQEICSALSHPNLNIQNVRGQGYDELALVAAAKEVVDVHAFFQSLSNIINVVCSFCKHNDKLRYAYATEIFYLVATNQIETGRGANQIGTLKRSGDTRWSSHFNSICSLLRMFGATTSVLEDLATNGSTYSQRGDATYALKSLLSFDFVFICHMMKEIMRITDKLCQALQQKSQDILNAMHLVSSTKSLIQQLRDSSWGTLLEKVSSFYNYHAIQIPDMGASFSDIIRSRRKKNVVTVEHHYRVDILLA